MSDNRIATHGQRRPAWRQTMAPELRLGQTALRDRPPSDISDNGQTLWLSRSTAGCLSATLPLTKSPEAA
jgi:hypothetical protein